jgi:glycosyltransferase involved in cell wall biosynthesis
VLHVDTSSQWRGGQRQLELLVAHLSHPTGPVEQQWVMLPDDAPLRARLSAPTRSLPRWGRSAAVQRLADELRADVIALHDRGGLRLAPRSRAARVVHRRVDFVPSAAALPAYRAADGVVAVSGAVAGILRQRGVRRVEVVSDGVEVPDVPVASAGMGRRLLAVGALVPHKGHDDLLVALTMLPGTTLWVAGTGELEGRLRRRVSALGLRGRVRWLGQVPDARRLFGQVDLLVHPSREEGMGQVVREALVAGLPVVATRAGGLPEAMDGQGLLAPVAHPAGLARTVRAALAQQQALRAALQRARPQLAERWGAARMAAQTADAYRRARAHATLHRCLAPS